MKKACIQTSKNVLPGIFILSIGIDIKPRVVSHVGATLF